jgi:hypothetical protein
MSSIPPETPPRVFDYLKERIRRGLGEPSSTAGSEEVVLVDQNGGGPHLPGMDIGERLARLEVGQDWMKVILGLLGAVVIGGFAFLGVQINRLDSKMDTLSTSLSARIDNQGAQTRQELVGIANAISSSITAARQVQPQIVIVPAPTPGEPTPKPQPKQ